MPAKRKRKLKNQDQKESQVIRTRLIEISLKLDDFIYQKKPICESEAEMYSREVVSYKTKCSKDERSLQVIDKIVRCMKSIIAELQETQIDHCNTYDENSYLDAGAASPVYSLEDEDRTQLAQEVTEEQNSSNPAISNTIATESIDFNDNGFNETQFTQIEQNQILTDNKDNPIPIITISDNDEEDSTVPEYGDTNIVTRPMLYLDAEMHRALSNLSLKDVSQKEMTDTDVGCSQSILNNFDDIDKLEQETHSDDRRIINKEPNLIEPMHVKLNWRDQNITKHNEKAQMFDSRKATATSLNLKGTETNNDKNKTRCDLLSSKTLTCLGYTNSFVNSADKETVSAQNIPYKEKAKPVTTKTINVIRLNFTPVLHNSNQNKTITDQGKSNNENIVKKKRAPRKKKEKEANNSKNPKKDKDCNSKGNNDVNNIKPAPKRRNTKKINNVIKDCSIPIYNKNVENDLSWMENIRFVREIHDDEYDGKLAGLNENFWDNYHLPPNFDESDFL